MKWLFKMKVMYLMQDNIDYYKKKKLKLALGQPWV